MRPLSFIRYAIAFYGLALEAFYPFDSLPATISDELKESLKDQAKAVNYFSAVISISFLAVFVYLVVIFSIVHGVVRLAMRYRPKFRELVEKRMAERALKAQTKKKHSRRAVWRSVVFNLLFSAFLVVNDVIFNRPEDASSFKEGILARFEYLMHDALLIIYVQFASLSVMLFFGIIFSMARAILRIRRQKRALIDEESRLAPDEMAEVTVEGQKTFILEEKLVDISDGIDGIYEKIETYATPTIVEVETTDSVEEPLIKL